MSTSRAAPEDILQDQIFDLSARNAELTERLAGLVGGASGVAALVEEAPKRLGEGLAMLTVLVVLAVLAAVVGVSEASASV